MSERKRGSYRCFSCFVWIKGALDKIALRDMEEQYERLTLLLHSCRRFNFDWSLNLYLSRRIIIFDHSSASTT